MSRRLAILDRYSDLCKLIEMWVIHEVQSTAGSLGYPKKSPGFGEGQARQAGYVDPTGYSAWDHRAVARAIDKLAEHDAELFAAVKMYYMAWTVAPLVAQGFPFPPVRSQTYYDRLERAHAWLQSEWRIQLNVLSAGAQQPVIIDPEQFEPWDGEIRPCKGVMV